MNPFYKYLGKEDHLQKQVIDYLKFQYNVKAIPCNTESKKTKFEQFKFKYLGGYRGVLDLFIPVSKGKYHGLFIELKSNGVNLFKKNGDYFAGKKGEHIRLQNQEIERHLINDYYACFCIGFDESKKVIDKYFSL